MKCPYCGSALELGTLRSRGSNYFLPEGEKVHKILFYSKKCLENVNAIPLPPSPYSLSLSVEWPEAQCCRECRKIIISY